MHHSAANQSRESENFVFPGPMPVRVADEFKRLGDSFARKRRKDCGQRREVIPKKVPRTKKEMAQINR